MGSILDGKISIGMKVIIDGLFVVITGIESVDGTLDNQSVSWIALKIYSDRTLYERINEKITVGQILGITT